MQQRPSSFSIRRICPRCLSGLFELAWGADALLDLIGIISGLGFLGYILATWVLEHLRRGNYVSAAMLSVVGFILGISSLARIPAALILLLGGAILAATAFFSGNYNLFLP